MKVDERVVVVGFDPFQFAVSAANRRHGHGTGHNRPEAEDNVVGGDRMAVRPDQIVAHDDLVQHAVLTGLPFGDGIGTGEGIELPIEAKEAEARQAVDIGLDDGLVRIGLVLLTSP